MGKVESVWVGCCVSVQAGASFLGQPVLLVPKVVPMKNTKKEDSGH